METTTTDNTPYRIYELTRVKRGLSKSFIIEGLVQGFIRPRYTYEHPCEYNQHEFNGACALLDISYRFDHDFINDPTLFGLFMVNRKTDYDTGNEMITCEPLVDMDGKHIVFTHEELTESPFAQIDHTCKRDERGYPLLNSSYDDITIFSLPVSLKEKREMEAEEKNNQ